ncbi:MAG: hypothetical protein WAW45_07590, partial [Atribacterota bacterium]
LQQTGKEQLNRIGEVLLFCGLGGSQRWEKVVIMILSCSYLFDPSIRYCEQALACMKSHSFTLGELKE